MKKILLTSLMFIVVLSIIYIPVHLLLIHAATSNTVDYRQSVSGEWNAYQYYHEKERVACTSDIWMSMTFTEDALSIKGTILPEGEGGCEWLSGTSISCELDGKPTTFYLSMDERHLKVTVADTPYIILFRKSEGQ